MLQRLFKRKNATEAFWSWFKKNADVYYHFEQDQDILFPKLKAALKKVHPDLVFEFSQILEDGSREFIISADGIKSIFPVVADLVGQAPTLNKWKIVAFRQPRNHVTHIYYQNIAIS
ncbi:MAG: hypothetical protein J7576_18815, partial [Siphonobacter aquaeclarae]|nr:hypothetical protein [Siphonobacter aquaeclarae]